MKTIMVVDDESLVRIGMQSIVDWNQHGYEMLGTYKNGLEAWRAIQQTSPDVLLTDIQMPEMDGIELIKLVREHYPETSIIILSSHQDFDYARTAIQMQVHDYILKHKLEADELIKILSRLQFSNKKSDSTPNQLNSEKKKFLKSTRPRNKDPKVQLDKFSALSKKVKEDKHSFIAWFSFQPYKSDNDSQVELKTITATIEDHFSRNKSVLLLGEDMEMVHGFCFSTNNTVRDLESISQLMNQVVHTIKIQLNVQMSVSIGPFSTQIDDAVLSRTTTEEALLRSFYVGPSLFLTRELDGFRNFSKEEWILIRKKTRQLIFGEQFEELYSWIIEYGQQLEKEHIYPSEAIRLCRMVINNLIDSIMSTYHIDILKFKGEAVSVVQHLRRMETLTSWQAVTAVVKTLLESITATLQEIKNEKSWVKVVIDYIDCHYNEPIMLEDAAKVVNFSLNYLSRRFHEETGFSFTDYLTRKRVDKAMELFQQSNLSTEEIAYRVGYPNPNYFTKVFKRISGLTVTEFKKRNGILVNNLEGN